MAKTVRNDKAEQKPVFSPTPLEKAKLEQFKRMFPRECALLIQEHDARK